MDERESLTRGKEVLASFNGMKSDKKYCDFTLKIGDEEIPVHRNILAACSKYFDAMFTHKTKETETACAEIIGIEPSAVKQCLDYIYTGKVKFSRDNPKGLIHAADLMQLHGLKDLCFEYLDKNISMENCFLYMELAVTYNQPSFDKIFQKFFGEKFSHIIETEQFSAMDKAVLLQCLGCLSEGSSEAEELKFRAVKTWVNVDVENRSDTFPELFEMIQLENVSMEFLRRDVAKDDLVRGRSQCWQQVYESLVSDERVSGNLVAPGDALTDILAFHEESRILHKYDRKRKRWSRFTRVPKGIISSNSEIICLKGVVYAASPSGLTKFSNGTWLKVVNTEHSDGYCQVTSNRDIIYLVTKTFHIEYNTKTESSAKYQILEDLQLDDGFAIAASDDFLYALGGWKTDRLAIEFAFSSRVWEPISSMDICVRNGAAMFCAGRLIALGAGYNSSFQWYDPLIDTWSTLPTSGKRGIFHGPGFKIFGHEGKFYALHRGNFKITELNLDLDVENSQKQLSSTVFCPIPGNSSY